MYIAFVLLGCTLFVTTACAAKLLVCIGVFGCGCPISDSVIICGTASLALMYIAPISDSTADVMTAFMIWVIFNMAPLLSGMEISMDKKTIPPDLLLAPGSLR